MHFIITWPKSSEAQINENRMNKINIFIETSFIKSLAKTIIIIILFINLLFSLVELLCIYILRRLSE